MSVHKSLAHDSGPLHVTGQARYVDDIPTPTGTLHLAFGVSSVASARIQSVDLSAVQAAEGVVAVLTAEDLPFANDVSPSIHDEPLLATGEVHYLGQPIFLVVATSHLAARKAARLGQISYETREPILTVEAAMTANSRFEDGPRIWQSGDALGEFSSCPNRITGQLDVGGQEHFYLEGQASLAMPQENGDVLVHASTQHPTEIQHKVAEALGLPMHGVRVETRRMGGGFGGKESQGNALAVACAVVAIQTGKPCKMRYDRDDDMMITGKRHDIRVSYDVGFDDTGRVRAIEFKHYMRCGWAQDLSLPVADRAMLHADNAYDLPNIRIESHRLKTNHQSATAFRGFGGPQGMIGIERVMDHIAHKLGMDPLAVRRANYYDEADSLSEPTGSAAETSHQKLNKTPYGMKVTDFVLGRLTQELEASSDYHARRAAIADWNDSNPVLKRGISLTPVKFGISFTLTHLNQAGALVHVYQDGSVMLNHGGTEMGQGLFQKVAQVAASVFGIGVDQIKITATDTAKVPNTSATAASSGADLNGMAVRVACEKLRARIATHLAEKHSCEASAVEFSDGNVIAGSHRVSFAEAASAAYQARVSLSATGFYKTPDLQWDRIAGKGRPFYYFAYGGSVTEVVIDTLTGENRILRADILHDAGKSLNPVLDIGQIEGGYVQGAGWVTTEELVWDDTGNLRTHAPSTYKIPACSDRPDVFKVALFENENRENTIHRSKAVGEPPFMLGISALMAISDAISACGDVYPSIDGPATPERVLAAVNRVRNGV
ncbi:MAG: xanthine dehydrogenase molybdopterin binding subunit [Paracoccaceae bacterium]|nr:xanthine dehydrogenase molybdopterin binding subunit [Paracoccaceae bacterium]MDG2258057.1 xanthine dehydrogenase molybdopterin binding subunit [Paracoccaceae bacterium]